MSNAHHPLTDALLHSLSHGARVLVLGAGNGRNLWPLLDAGHSVDVIEPDPQRAALVQAAARPGFELVPGPPAGFANRYDGFLSTSGLLHGTRATSEATLAAVIETLRPGATLAFTLGSTRDARFGKGTRIDDNAWAQEDGPEAGVAHAFFDRTAVASLLRDADVVALTEEDAAQSAGTWAHGQIAGSVHWFVRARKR